VTAQRWSRRHDGRSVLRLRAADFPLGGRQCGPVPNRNMVKDLHTQDSRNQGGTDRNAVSNGFEHELASAVIDSKIHLTFTTRQGVGHIKLMAFIK